MTATNWQKQTKDKPLFPEILWSRPENKHSAGKLLIIGGNAHGFAVPAQSFVEATKAGVGVAKVLLPDALKKTVGTVLETAEFAPSTRSGSFNQKALAVMLDLASWSDGVLIAGELGRNAETAAVLEKFLNKSSSLITITKDAVDVFNSDPRNILERENTAIVLSLAQLQRIAKEVSYPEAVTFSMGQGQLAEWLHDFTGRYQSTVLSWHLGNIFVGKGGAVSSTAVTFEEDIWRIPTATRAAVWWLQNSSKPFAAISSSLITIDK